MVLEGGHPGYGGNMTSLCEGVHCGDCGHVGTGSRVGCQPEDAPPGLPRSLEAPSFNQHYSSIWLDLPETVQLVCGSTDPATQSPDAAPS